MFQLMEVILRPLWKQSKFKFEKWQKCVDWFSENKVKKKLKKVS